MPIQFDNRRQSQWFLYSLSNSLTEQFRSMEKLASGLRINRASDDPAGLVISEQLRSRIGSLNAEISNISGTINKYQTVSSTVAEMRSELTELRSLAVGAANEAGNSEEAQQAYAAAAENIVSTYNGTIESAEYNGSKTLDGSEGSLASVSQLTDIDLSSAETAAASIDRIDQAISELDDIQVDLGATQKNDLEGQLRSMEITRQNLIAAESQVRDVDFVEEYTNFVVSSMKTRATMAMWSHANILGKEIIKLWQG